MTTRFDIKDPAESVVLTFDFALGLAVGETLLAVATVTCLVAFGTDATPAAVLTGSKSIDATNTKVLVGVTGGLDQTDYDIKVRVTTSTSGKILTLAGILPVRAE